MTLKLSTSLLLSLLLLVVAATLDPRPACANDFDDHYKRGMALYEKKEYDEAAGELLKAYEVRQLPRVLLNLGTIYRKMGKAAEALSFYERYLKAEPNPPAKLRKDIDTFISQTRALVDTPEVQTELERKKEPAPVGWDRDSGQMQPWLAAQLANRPLYQRPWFWVVVGGVVAAGVITGAVVGVTAQKRAIPNNIDILQLQLTF